MTANRGTRKGVLAVMRRAVVLPIVIYRKLVSPLIAPRCRYHPSCSTYAVEALRDYGALRGLTLAVWRLLRCNPFSAGGVDLVSDQRLFVRRVPRGPKVSRS